MAAKKPLDVIVDVDGVPNQTHMKLTPDEFQVDGNVAHASFYGFAFDPHLCRRVEVIDGVRWIATEVNVEPTPTGQKTHLYLERAITEKR